MNQFELLSSVDVSSNVEKKGNFSYLSWTFAIEALLIRFPEATWEIKRFPMREQSSFMVPYLKTDFGCFVEVEVTVNNITRGQIHPVLNNHNKPINEPTSFDINTSIQRALVKAIALHGLGLYIYAREDLPTETRKLKKMTTYKNIFDKLIENKDDLGMFLYLRKLDSDHGEFTISNDLFSSFPDGEKVRSKDNVNNMQKVGCEIFNLIKEHIENDDTFGVKENTEGLSKMTKKLLFDALDKEQQHKITIMLKGE